MLSKLVLSAPTVTSAPHWISGLPSKGAFASSKLVAPLPESNKSYSSSEVIPITAPKVVS